MLDYVKIWKTTKPPDQVLVIVSEGEKYKAPSAKVEPML
jgi:hypothetical protein